MSTLLVISANELDGVAPSDDWSVTRVESLSDARAVAREADAIALDLRSIDFDADAFEDEVLFTRGTPTVAVIPADDPHLTLRAKSSQMACIDERWLDSSGPAILRFCVERTHVAFSDAHELDRLKRQQEQILHAEKFAAVGLLAAEIAHEINNPATFVITNLTVMMDYVDTIAQFHADLRTSLRGGVVDEEHFEQLEEAHEIGFLSEDLQTLLARSLAGLNRIHQIVQDLRYFSQDRSTDARPIDVAALVHAAMNLVRHEARFHAEVKVDVEGLPRVRSDANRISQVILNVLVNAVQSIPAGHPGENLVTVEGEVDEEFVDIVVADTGTGIPPDHLDRIFEPFFTTKERGKGTGLGLSISRDIMRGLGGDILAESEPGVGSRFTIRVPRHSSEHDD